MLNINCWLTGSLFADPDQKSGEVQNRGEATTC